MQGQLKRTSLLVRNQNSHLLYILQSQPGHVTQHTATEGGNKFIDRQINGLALVLQGAESLGVSRTIKSPVGSQPELII